MNSITISPCAFRRTVSLFTLSLLFAASGCSSLKIGTPAKGSTVAEPVSISASATSDIQPQSVSATLDGMNVSTLFTIDPGSRSVSAKLPMSLGTHTVHVEAKLWNGLYQQYYAYSDDTSFTAAAGGGLTLALPPGAMAVEPGTTGILNVGVARSGAFHGDVSVALIAPPNNSSSSTTIPAASSSGSINIAIPSGLLPSETNITVFANGPLYNSSVGDSKTLTFRVAHKSGSFKHAMLGARMPYQSATGPDGSTQVNIGNGATATYEARFVRGTTTVGDVIGFNPGPAANSFGGAGFCPTPGVGFVVSATGPGVSGMSDAVLFVRYFEDAGYRAALDLATSKSPTAPFVKPEILFSPACGVVIAVGADTASPKNYRGQAYDFFRSKNICAVSFNDPPAGLQAKLTAPAIGNQNVEITTDGMTTSCPVF